MSLVSSPKTSDRACIGKAPEPTCNVTDDNLASDCYESLHAFKKIRTSTSGLRKSPNKWTKEENQKLAALVANYGEKKWKRISAEMGGQKTGAQCAQHWKRVLSPEIRKGHWDENEEDLLLRLVVQYGSCWKKIAKKIPQRTDIQCRYQYLKAKQSREVSWDAKEDESLIKKVMEMANCNYFLMHDINGNSNDTPSPSSSSSSCSSLSSSPCAIPSRRNSSNFNTSASGSPFHSSPIGTPDSNKENDSSLSSSCGSDSKEDDRMKCSGEFGKDAWSERRDVSMSDSSPSGGNGGVGSSWKSKDASLSGGTCANCHRPFGNHTSRIVWLEISEHMARLKLTSTLRTALECKTRFSELLGNKISFSGGNGFCSSGGSTSAPEIGGKHFDLKHSGGRGGDTTCGGGGGGLGGFGGGIGAENSRHGFHNDIKINNRSTGMPSSSAPANGCNSNNINLTNCNNNNITINITNSYTSPSSESGIIFPQIAHHAATHAPRPLKTEHMAELRRSLSKTSIPPILSPAPPFPSSFTHLSPSTFPHLPPPNPSMMQSAPLLRVGFPLNVPGGVNGLESLAAVASILPREMLAADYAQF